MVLVRSVCCYNKSGQLCIGQALTTPLELENLKFKWIFDLRTQLEEKLRIERENTNQFGIFSTGF